MSAALKQPAQRQPLAAIDPQTKSLLITREWYTFLLGIYERVGGATGDDNTSLAQGLPEDAGLEELKLMVYDLSQQLQQSQSQVAELREQLVELTKSVQALQVGNLL